MSFYEGTLLGMTTEAKDEALAIQFMTCVGADLKRTIVEEIGILDQAGFQPVLKGAMEDDNDVLKIIPSIQGKVNAYKEKYLDYYLIEEEKPVKESATTYKSVKSASPSRLDDLSLLVSKLFENAVIFFAYEDGSSSSDTYYRYEASLDPATGKKKEINCYFSCDGGPDREHGTEWIIRPIKAKTFNEKIMNNLIEKAKNLQYHELAAKLEACR